MTLTSTAFSSWGPLCQAAIVTFQPVGMAQNLLLSGIAFFALLKLLASVAKVYLTIQKLPYRSKPTAKLATIIARHTSNQKLVAVIDDSRLLAFSSNLPFISNGIFISKGACRCLTSKELEAVFVHELHHWRHRDSLMQLCLKITSDVFFFIPSLRDLLSHWQLNAELKADSAVVAALGTQSSLKQALAKWLSKDAINPIQIWAVAFAETQLAARIKRLTQASAANTNTLSAPMLFRLLVSILVVLGITFVQTKKINQVQAQLIIPTSSQCTQVWQENAGSALQSSIFSAMSRR